MACANDFMVVFSYFISFRCLHLFIFIFCSFLFCFVILMKFYVCNGHFVLRCSPIDCNGHTSLMLSHKYAILTFAKNKKHKQTKLNECGLFLAIFFFLHHLHFSLSTFRNLIDINESMINWWKLRGYRTNDYINEKIRFKVQNKEAKMDENKRKREREKKGQIIYVKMNVKRFHLKII